MPLVFEVRNLPSHIDLHILSMIGDVPVSRSEIVSKTGLKPHDASNCFIRLERRGLIESIGKKKATRYRLSQTGQSMLAEAKRIYGNL